MPLFHDHVSNIIPHFRIQFCIMINYLMSISDGCQVHCTKKVSIKDFFSKCNQIRRKLWIWSHLLKKCLMEKFIFCAAALKVQITPIKTMYYVLITVCFHKEQYFLGASSQPRQTSKIEGFAE